MTRKVDGIGGHGLARMRRGCERVRDQSVVDLCSAVAALLSLVCMVFVSFEVARRSLPNPSHRIGVEVGIAADNRNLLDHCLSDDESVERITVVKR